MIKFANFIPAVLGILGLDSFREKEGRKCLSDTDRDELKKYGFTEKWIQGFESSLNEQNKNQQPANPQAAAIAAVLGQTTERLEAVTAELEELKSTAAGADATHKEAIAAKESKIKELNDKIALLSAAPEDDPAKPVGGASVSSSFDLSDDHQLGGMEGEYFSLDRPYNQRARAALLAAEGKQLIVASAERSDFKTLQDDLGAFYRTPWRDRLQSLLVKLPSITRVFPLEPGHQDLDTLVNIWLGEFSQADNTSKSDFDNVTKGQFDFNHETLRMYDVMFVHRFKNLKVIEKLWIGHLNKEGSNPLKLSFIEYLLVEVAKKLHNERELRWVNGVRKNPNPNVPGRAMEAADGIYEYLRKRIEGHTDFTPDGGTTGKTVYQIKPFALPRITPGNIGEVFYQGTSMVPSVFRDTGMVVLYIPSFMIPWYNKYNEMKYGRNNDYEANISHVKEFPSVRIEAIPNADNHHRIFWTIDGNIKTYEHVSGEMLKFNLEQEDWSLKSWSNWKEGIAAEAVGFKYTSKAEMDGSRQLIWANDYDMPDTYFLEGKSGENPDALLHSNIVTAANDGVFEITDILNARVGETITLKCGADGDNGVIIKKSGKFENISEAWKPVKGSVIVLMLSASGKFIEISRDTAPAEAYAFPADATAPSVAGATVFVTGANTKATALADLVDAVEGEVYTIHGSGSENATTIAKGGKFDIPEAMTLSDGKFIRLVKAADGKFHEVSRG